MCAGPYINYRAEAGTINDHDTFFEVTKFHGPAIIGGPEPLEKEFHEILVQLVRIDFPTLFLNWYQKFTRECILKDEPHQKGRW